MDFSDFSQALHVVGGGSEWGLLKQALHLRRDEVLMNEDPIYCGPTPATRDLRVWRSTRERFIKSMYVDWPDFSFDEYADNGLLMNAERLDRENAVVVWVGIGLPDQLLLAWVVFLFDRLGVDLSKLRVIQFENLGQRHHVLSMGEVSPENIRKYCPEPRHLNSVDLEELRRAWRVYTSNDPAALACYAVEPGPMPLLHRAISQLIHRYPEVRSGIGSWDERLLHYTSEKALKAARVIADTMGHGYGELIDSVGDQYLFQRLVALGSKDLVSPLVSFRGNTRSMRECEVRLTEFGRQVLAGEANHVRENGIDDWIGGVHLSTAAPVTFRDGDILVLPT